MRSQTPDMQAVLERLERLERQNRKIRTAAVAAVVVVAALVLAGGQKREGESEVVRAQRFVLVDAGGRSRAEISMDYGFVRGADDASKGVSKSEMVIKQSGPGLAFFDDTGRVRASFGFSNGGGCQLTFYDSRGASGIELTDMPGGMEPRPQLSIYGQGPGGYAVARIWAGGEFPGLSLIAQPTSLAKSLVAEEKATTISLLADRRGPRLRLSDRNAVSVSLGGGQLGRTHDTSATPVVVLEKDGTVIWRVP